MGSRRFRGMDFEEMDDENVGIKWESEAMLRERVLRNDFKKIYSLSDISKWVEYGIKNGLVKRSSKREDIELLMKWIDLLGKGGKNISLR
tara:strand:- start:336 stop:605 length:270 start_codon:yes stop_codon:yes gene_type:complete